MSGISLRAQNVFKKLKRNEALKGLSMNFEAHKIHGIIGPEGSGKTTFLRHIIGLLKPDAGEIHFFDEGVEVAFQDIRESLAYMPQTQSLYPDLSIHEHLEFFRILYNLPNDLYQERRNKLLQMSRLSSFVDRLASQLSGGMYKKLGLICSLLSAPRVLLLDEPTNGVDPLSRRDFWELLYDLRGQEDVLIIVTTSYMDEALKCQNVHLLFNGKTLVEGSPQDILNEKKCKTFDEVFLQYDSMEASL